MTPGRKYTLLTSIFYLLLLLLIPLFNRLSPNGPCNPGFGFLFLSLTLLTAVIGFIAFAVGRIKGNRLLTGPFFVNAIVLAALLLLIFAGRL